MKKAILALLSIVCTTVQAQVIIEGRLAYRDTLSKTVLATVPEPLFGTDATLTVQTGIDAPRSMTFRNISAESKHILTYQDNDGNTRTDTLMFTFLPIVQLLGNFGYEYQEGIFLFSHPDSATTDTLTARIKWRGGTTNAANKHKHNYKVNFDEDHRFFGLRNDDKWMLDAGQPDVFRLRNRIAMDLWNKMARKPYYADQEPKALNGVRGDIVELFLGNEWRGIYNLSEFIDRKQLKLKKIDDKTGIIRGCLYKGVSWNKTKMFDIFDSYDNSKDTFFGYEFKYPELGDDSDTIDWAPLIAANNFVKESEDKEFQQHVSEYFDMPVIMDYNIFYNVVNAVDNAGKNMYWAIYDKTSTKQLTPTPWDLDATFGQRWGGRLVYEIDEGFYNSPEFRLDFELMLTYRLFRDNFNDYVGQLNERYRQLRLPGQPLHTDSIISIVTRYYQAVKNSGAAKREEEKWSQDTDVWGDIIDFDTEYIYICDWIRRRMEFIDVTELPLFYKKSYFDELSVRMPTSHFQSPTSQIYNLKGQRMEDSIQLKPGIYIKYGKKFIK